MGKKINTKIIHVGSNPEIHQGSINDPIFKNSTLVFKNYKSFLNAKRNKFTLPYYGRFGGYTIKRLEKIISSLYSSENSIITSSGLSSITITLQSLLKQNDEILVTENCYEPVANFLNSHLSRFGIKSKYYNSNVKSISKLINNNTKVIYLESPGSLNFEVQDIEEISKIAKERKIITVMDNTWSTFLGCNPFNFGIDIVVESLTKYFSGHSDNFCGIITCSNKYYLDLKKTAVRLGDFVSPESCFDAVKGLKTLPTRMKQHQANSDFVYKFLRKFKIVDEIIYLPEKKNKYNKLWKKYHSLNNGLITFSLIKKNKIEKFLNNLKLFKLGFSWGGYESLIIPINSLKPAIKNSKINNYWFRIHVGLEAKEDLTNDLKFAIDKYEEK
ncbi:MAG: Cystathionine beta-lyase [Alphaproteobacteria bacterium MarineAlpha8_Bin1]|nr:MAG: Cystathionine beta-lyase [Alphaproteobacteria bacterium MarineAlpha8_Bin1]|tara:strand:- start:133 stop:1290 length:1158 start_codon:yes stop_codon:yes gene_type:complete